MTYHKVADEDLEDLGLQARAVAEGFLEQPDQEVAHGSADQGTIRRHLGNPRGEVVAMLVPVLGKPRREHFLETSEGTGREHLGADGVLLELLDIRL